MPSMQENYAPDDKTIKKGPGAASPGTSGRQSTDRIVEVLKKSRTLKR